MEDFGDYIYLIAIAIAGLSSLFKKKKTAESNQERNMPDLDDVLPDTEEEYYPRSEPDYREEPVTMWSEPVAATPVKPVAEQWAPVSYETVADYMKLRAKKTVHTTHSAFESIQPVETPKETGFDIELESVEDVKRAFVYSEIFNRKY
jgi:hypothetical protein